LECDAFILGFSTLKMEAANSFEKLVTRHLPTRRHIAEYKNLYTLLTEKLSSITALIWGYSAYNISLPYLFLPCTCFGI